MSVHDEIKENVLTHAMGSIVARTIQYSELSGMSVCEVLRLVKSKIDNKDCNNCN